MIVEFTSEEDLSKKLQLGYIEELKSYCESKGFTSEQTAKFIEKTLTAEEKHRALELGE